MSTPFKVSAHFVFPGSGISIGIGIGIGIGVGVGVGITITRGAINDEVSRALDGVAALRGSAPGSAPAGGSLSSVGMVFNILIDNTDDHERNHSVRLGLDGYHELTPACDVLPTLLNLGHPALAVGRAGAESSLDNALSDINEFGLKRARAIALIKQVAHAVSQWRAHFTACGVSAADLDLLAASIDRPALKLQLRECA